ncbi:NADH-quinone oxidoreductase subunit N [Mucilaginibacter aquatilis]|uniref:NADH-quinone oxidoreductase subunit N n=1 Tax=Mucilaginibacter aquatilis TaxID=1517760 RepID=A0A6I4I460_9SPHI|nr:NADH-quinone oxidoreductase subunit N [Mucilaginibacter aquatilis]MVN89841.1 NADH-quinone oxidoreductase subunit NuoN [Mucilaginibacter aquatilis]
MQQYLPYISNSLNDTLDSLTLFRPEIALGILFLLVMMADLIYRKSFGAVGRMLACAGMLLVMAADLGVDLTLDNRTQLLFNGNLLVHHDNIVLRMIIDSVAFLLLLYIPWDDDLKAHPKGLGDMYTIITGSVLGMHLMVMSATLLTMLISVEMVSLASYLLVAYRGGNRLSAEAGLKYVLFGLAASAVMLYGISLFYGFAGTINLFDARLFDQLQQADSGMVMLSIALILAGIGFKLSLVPLHFWVPDVYQGASTPVTAYLSTLPKVAGFGLLITFLTPFISTSSHSGFDFRLVLSIVGIITLVAGNFAAVWQQNIKRMMAYSSVGHSGFALMAIVTFSSQGIDALNFYLAVYALANLGVLALVSYFANAHNAHTLDDLKGLGFKYPIASVCFVILLISLTGIPVSAGFSGKLLVFSSVYAVYQDAQNPWLLALLITGAVTTVVSLFYYIKIPLYLFLKKADADVGEHPAVSKNMLSMIVIISVAILLLGIFPHFLSNLM